MAGRFLDQLFNGNANKASNKTAKNHHNIFTVNYKEKIIQNIINKLIVCHEMQLYPNIFPHKTFSINLQ